MNKREGIVRIDQVMMKKNGLIISRKSIQLLDLGLCARTSRASIAMMDDGMRAPRHRRGREREREKEREKKRERRGW